MILGLLLHAELLESEASLIKYNCRRRGAVAPAPGTSSGKQEIRAVTRVNKIFIFTFAYVLGWLWHVNVSEHLNRTSR